ncbi:hypothetical protein DB728_12680 [Rhizobium leguminosarum bv. viciae USDA 2370]|nr:hypothetical protein [Rhizobium leguminosarum]PUB62628.1 hypothetical protein DB728_12680 [Rhizobium leguminosarum bv. viciae USDA 2370]
MAAEVKKLMEIVPPTEARAFLKARCNLPAFELSPYVGFPKALKGSNDVLRKARASIPVIKALVSADAEARQEILERLKIGALMAANGWSGAKELLRAMRAQPFYDRFGSLIQIGALSSTLRGRTGKGRSKEGARRRSKGFT